MTTSENGISFLKANEGFVSHAYADNGHQAIGYGHDIQPGESFPPAITERDADTLLRKDLAERYEPAVNALIPACTQNQFDALVDFAYNLGIANLKTMLGHGWEQVPIQIPRWDKVNGVSNPGLAARREKEVALFRS
jgi:lysozyme